MSVLDVEVVAVVHNEHPVISSEPWAIRNKLLLYHAATPALMSTMEFYLGGYISLVVGANPLRQIVDMVIIWPC